MKSRLGQHMLIDKSIVRKMLEAANISNKDVVFEIGTGRGILTAEICKKAKHVISCEIDKRLFESAKLSYNNLTLLNADGFDVGHLYDFNLFISSLPYYRSRDAIEFLASKNFERAVILVQKEFAEKILKSNRAVSALAKYCFHITPILHVPRDCFRPLPKVDSMILLLVKKNSVSKDTIKALKTVFAFKGRKVNSIAKKFALELNQELLNKRIEDLEPAEAINLADLIGKRVQTVR